MDKNVRGAGKDAMKISVLDISDLIALKYAVHHAELMAVPKIFETPFVALNSDAKLKQHRINMK
ncbi:putative endonuclease 4 OS=Lysinibacillus sphaericus OX=1421 GN=nfo PE=3 SV=1 [Lysinibacillus sphaericus]